MNEHNATRACEFHAAKLSRIPVAGPELRAQAIARTGQHIVLVGGTSSADGNARALRRALGESGDLGRTPEYVELERQRLDFMKGLDSEA